MPSAATCFFVAGLLMQLSVSLRSEQKFPPDTFVNLQIFPNDTPPGVLITAMKNFTRALGVRCQFCHVGEEGLPLEKFDFVSDTKSQKQLTRQMMRMTAEINAQITKAIPDAAAQGQQVTCYTCHRGQQHPQHSPDSPKPPPAVSRD
jgi:photosynthetic reaction center cytochrome c subunit